MEASDGSPPPSLCMVRAAELFPKPQMELEDTQLKVPFPELAGESVKYLGRTDDGVLALSNYRIFLQKSSTNVETSIPLGLIESAQSRDLFHLIIYCKDASTVKCSFETAEQCTEWQRRIQMCTGVPETLESIFAFPFCSWACDTLQSATAGGGGVGSQTYNSNADNVPNPSTYSVLDYAERLQKSMSRYEDDFMREVERLSFDLNGSWRISHANEEFKLCPSYPPKLLVPCCISDETLNNVANFRGSRRLPAVVWRHRKSGAVIARCSQPEVGWLGWRNTKDEQLLKALADACAFDRGEQTRQMQASQPSSQSAQENTQQVSSGDSSPSSPDGSHEEVAMDEVRKILIVDARSYTSAVTNRARGGGCECIEYYPCAEIEFMNLGNIHVIRKSFHALRQLCGSPPDVPNWLGLLEKTMWFQHLSGLLAASMTVCHAIEKKGRPVLVHCSDGWDRTPQIVATAQLCLDPYYRTVEGFRVLVEREWLSFGHKFADRCGHGPGSEELNERCPVFLQWLDLVHQIHKQFSCSFEFSMGYLIKMAQHSHSGLFGNFLCNTLKERLENSVFERTFSVWSFLNRPMYRNPLYKPGKDKVLWPAHNVRDMKLWTEVYLGSLGGNQNCIDFPAYVNENLAGSISSMSKTRSYGDLITAGFIQNSMSRRSSDPNMTVDPNLTIGSNSENNSIADLQSDDREESPDILANLIHDTTQQLENLTNELNNHDCHEDFKLPTKQSGIGIEFKDTKLESIHKDNDNELFCKTTTIKLLNSNDKQEEEEEEPQHQEQLQQHQQQQHQEQLQKQQQQQEKGCDHKTTITKDFHLTLKNVNGVAKNQLSESEDARKEKMSTDVLDSLSNGVNGFERSSNGITIETHSRLGADLMKSLVVDDPMCNGSSSSTVTGSKLMDESQNLWHGNLNTSTDTLVPVTETKSQNGSYCDTLDGQDVKLSPHKSQLPHNLISFGNDNHQQSKISTSCEIMPKVHSNSNASTMRPNQLSTISYNNNSPMQTNTIASSSYVAAAVFKSDNGTIIPGDSTNNTTATESKMMVQPPQPPSVYGMEESILILPEHRKLEISFSGKCETIATANTTATSSSCPETVSNVIPVQTPSNLLSSATYTTLQHNTTTAASSQRRRRTSSTNSKRDAFVAKHISGSYISRFSVVGGGGGVRSLPMTPPGMTERPQVTISCPDGLAHALSEENIRLQQIVHEHKLREDALLREIHDMRMALLKKICPNCNNANVSNTNDEQKMHYDNSTTSNLPHRRYLNAASGSHRLSSRNCCDYHRRKRKRRQLDAHDVRNCVRNAESDDGDEYNDENENNYDDMDVVTADYSGSDNDDDDDDDDDDDEDIYSVSGCSALDNVENASICSWEAVEDRSTSGPSSCTTTSSSIQPNAMSVLWVPDYTVSCCTSCQAEFWLGRRKHHCRSCGQIFCADCSEFWAPLPDAKLFSPVRLCGPCYHSVTTRIQQVNNQLQNTNLLHLQQSVSGIHSNSGSNNTSTTTAPNNSNNSNTMTKPAAAASKA